MSRKLTATRRGFLGALAGAASLTGPAWITDAFASAMPDEEQRELFGAYRRAQQSGRPLLVLVIPEDSSLRWERGRLLGALINYGGDDVLAGLATVAMACASTKTLAALGPKVNGEPWMVLVGTDTVPATVRTADVSLETNVTPREDDWEGADELEARLQNARVAISQLLLSDAGALEARAAQGAIAHPEETRALEAALISGIPSVELAAAAPARMAIAIRDASGRRQAALATILADAGRAEYRDQKVTGSHWANSHGCGTTIEDVEQNWAVGCGMGRVPQKATRFLYFFDPSEGRW